MLLIKCCCKLGSGGDPLKENLEFHKRVQEDAKVSSKKLNHMEYPTYLYKFQCNSVLKLDLKKEDVV